MTLTVTEKEHWKTRIEAKINRRIKTLIADTNPTYLEEIRSRARSLALKELGIADLQERYDSLEQEEQNIKRQLFSLDVELAALVTGRSRDTLRQDGSYHLEQLKKNAVEENATLLENRLMSEDELGRSVLKLRSEREELLDTIWLATSPRQIRELWKDVSDLLGEEPTELQQSALSTPPADSSGS